ncbi:hypothetical protein [Nocardioides zeae]
MSRFTDVVVGLVLVVVMVALVLRAATIGGWWWAVVPVAVLVALVGGYGAARAVRRTPEPAGGTVPDPARPGRARDRW